MVELTHLETTYVDTYLVDVILKAQADHPPVRATRVVVELEHVPDDHAAPTATVHVAVTGERIVKLPDGRHTTANTGTVRVFGLAEEPTRYNLCRDAILESLHRHRQTIADVSSFAFQEPWEEHRRSLEVGAVNLSGAVSRHLTVPGGDDIEDDRF